MKKTGKNDDKKVLDIKEKKLREISAFRSRASKLTSMANKRIQRLEKNNLTDSPAYKKYIEGGGHRFGVRGKTYNEVQAEVARLRNFLDAETSTIRGYNKVLKDMASNTGIKYKNMQDLRSKSGAFFELASKVEQYLRTIEDIASAIGYQKIWEVINVYVKENKIDLANADEKIAEMTEQVSRAIATYKEPTPIITGWYDITDEF